MAMIVQQLHACQNTLIRLKWKECSYSGKVAAGRLRGWVVVSSFACFRIHTYTGAYVSMYVHLGVLH